MNKFKQLYNNTRKIILDGETLYPAKLKDMTIENAISAKKKEIATLKHRIAIENLSFSEISDYKNFIKKIEKRYTYNTSFIASSSSTELFLNTSSSNAEILSLNTSSSNAEILSNISS